MDIEVVDRAAGRVKRVVGEVIWCEDDAPYLVLTIHGRAMTKLYTRWSPWLLHERVWLGGPPREPARIHAVGILFQQGLRVNEADFSALMAAYSDLCVDYEAERYRAWQRDVEAAARYKKRS